jgi:hypothetical protein
MSGKLVKWLSGLFFIFRDLKWFEHLDGNSVPLFRQPFADARTDSDWQKTMWECRSVV